MRVKYVAVEEQHPHPVLGGMKPVFTGPELHMEQVGGVIVIASAKDPSRHFAVPVARCKRIEYADIAEVLPDLLGNVPVKPAAAAGKR